MRRRIHNHVEGAFLVAQYPDGHVYYDIHGIRLRAHTECIPLRVIQNMIVDDVRVYLTDAPIYAPDQCMYCSVRNLRARGRRG